MILSDIGIYLRNRGHASLNDIAQHFDAQPDAVRGMLDIWIKKGKVVRQRMTASCGSSCNQCDSTITEIYSWSNSTTASRDPATLSCDR